MQSCSFYLGQGKAIEGLGRRCNGGWNQPVLYAASTLDYLHKVLQSIDDTAKCANFSLDDSDCAFTWHDACLFAKIEGRWVRVTKTIRAELEGAPPSSRLLEEQENAT